MKLIFIMLAFICVTEALANDGSQQETLDKVYIQDEFRIFYALHGKHALPEQNLIDLNNNHIPDFIEKIADKLQTAMSLYTQQYKFQNPFESKRYHGKIAYIDIHVINFASHGAAIDEILLEKYPITIKKINKVLVIKVLNSLSQETHTPEHELFHLFQNGYSMFKNRWYTEGTARWIEQSFFKKSGDMQTLPANAKEFKRLFGEKYNAQLFWNRLTYLCDASNPINAQARLNKQYIYGVSILKAFLENLENESNIATASLGFQFYNWPEDAQINNSLNNMYILRALKNAIFTQCPKVQIASIELNNFIKELDNQIITSNIDGFKRNGKQQNPIE